MPINADRDRHRLFIPSYEQLQYWLILIALLVTAMSALVILMINTAELNNKNCGKAAKFNGSVFPVIPLFLSDACLQLRQSQCQQNPNRGN
jgi:hypothetical protein